MVIDVRETSEILKKAQNVLIISHKNPDGDTLGSAYALYYGLVSLGKKATIVCSDERPTKFDFYTNEHTKKSLLEIPDEDFDLIVAVDVADQALFGEVTVKYSKMIDLCIDHHPSNKLFAEKTCLIPTASATCEIMYDVLTEMNATIDILCANCIYGGIATDTGCFKFSNTTSKTHYIAAKLIDIGCDYATINREMFEKKSRARILLEQHVLNSMEFHFDCKCAIVEVSINLMKKLNAKDEEFDGVSAIPRQIEGVYVGVTLKEIEDGYKISVRTNQHIDACAICQNFGGGGHLRAAGCVIKGDFPTVKAQILEKVKEALAK
jgi:phosphoesterase RecJ-like protein